jgi:hypothetical protein
MLPHVLYVDVAATGGAAQQLPHLRRIKQPQPAGGDDLQSARAEEHY